MRLRWCCLIAFLCFLFGPPALAQSKDSDRPDGDEQVIEQIEDDDPIENDRPIVVRVPDLENHEMHIELDMLVTRDRDGAPTKIRFPVLYRVDTGPDTELRVFSDFFTIQDPTRGFGDINLAVKWQAGPRTSLVVGAEVPTGSAGFADPGVEPNILLSQEIILSKRWEIVLNGSVAFQRDSASLDYYAEFDSATQLGYHITPQTMLSAAVLVRSPDALDNGITRISGALSLTHDFSQENSLNFTLGRSFSSTGDDFLVLLGWTHKI